MSSVYSRIRQAIRDKSIVTAVYRGHRREMCPHAIGRKRGKEHALFYQFAGTSSTGLGPDGSPKNWRCLDLDELTEVAVRPGEWHSASNHSRPQRCIDEIDVEVSY
jgi:hypothetical protein